MGHQLPILLGGVESFQSHLIPSATQKHALGTLAELPDGRRFRYAKGDGTGFAAGTLLKTATHSAANFTDRDGTVAAAIGSTQITMTLGGAATADQFADGFLWINAGTGAGYQYKIRTHPAGTTAVVFQLHDPISVATLGTSGTSLSLVTNPYNGVGLQAAQASLAAIHAGVSTATFGVSQFGWVQTRGLVPVLASTTGPVAFQAGISGAAGTATVVTAVTELPFGYSVNAETASGEYAYYFITID